MFYPRNRAGKGSRKGAFTLLEILLVLALLAILVALSSASIVKIQKMARNATCVSNLRQLGSAGLLYAAEHNGKLPARDGWYKNVNPANPNFNPDSLRNYLPDQRVSRADAGSKIFVCPTLDAAQRCDDSQNTYGLNTFASGSSWTVKDGNTQEPLGPSRLAQVLKPSSMIFFGDSLFPIPSGAPPNTYYYTIAIGVQGTGRNDYSDPKSLPHHGCTQCVFLDGSVRRVSSGELKNADKTSDLWRGGYSDPSGQ